MGRGRGEDRRARGRRSPSPRGGGLAAAARAGRRRGAGDATGGAGGGYSETGRTPARPPSETLPLRSGRGAACVLLQERGGGRHRGGRRRRQGIDVLVDLESGVRRDRGRRRLGLNLRAAGPAEEARLGIGWPQSVQAPMRCNRGTVGTRPESGLGLGHRDRQRADEALEPGAEAPHVDLGVHRHGESPGEARARRPRAERRQPDEAPSGGRTSAA